MIRLPYPPSLNKMYTNRKSDGRRLLTKKARNWIEEAYYILYSDFKCVKYSNRPLLGPIIFTLNIYPPDNRKRDISNLIKIVEDVFVKTKYVIDDRQTAIVNVRKCEIVKNGYVEASVNKFTQLILNSKTNEFSKIAKEIKKHLKQYSYQRYEIICDQKKDTVILLIVLKN